MEVKTTKCKHHLAKWQHVFQTPFDVIHMIYPFQAFRHSNVAGQTQQTWSNGTITSPECKQQWAVAWPKQKRHTSLSIPGLLLALLIPISDSAFSRLPPGGSACRPMNCAHQEDSVVSPVDTLERRVCLPTGKLKPPTTPQTLNVETQKTMNAKGKLFVFAALVHFFTKTKMDERVKNVSLYNHTS